MRIKNYIEGIDGVEISVKDLDSCESFLLDSGLNRVSCGQFKTLNESEITINSKKNIGLNSITLGVVGNLDFIIKKIKNFPGFFNNIDNNGTVECLEPNGIKLIFRLSQKKNLNVKGQLINSYNNVTRVNEPIICDQRITPVEIGHIVLETTDIAQSEIFYRKLGFVVSDTILNRGVFLRSKPRSGHHTIFLIESNTNKLHHIALTMKDVYDIFLAGKTMSKNGWKTAVGPGRHEISSAFFWYFNSPLGCMLEYNSNEDFLTSKWTPRNVLVRPDLSSEILII
jgi:predicted lactoylglutathione lyase